MGEIRTEIKRLKKLKKEHVQEINSKIEELQNKCTHNFKEISHSDDHDGYSRVTITYTTTYKCKECGKLKEEKSYRDY